MLVIHGQHIRDQLRLPFCYLIYWGRRSFLQSFCESQELRDSKKAAGKYTHVPVHIWMAQDITAQVADAFVGRLTPVPVGHHLHKSYQSGSTTAPVPVMCSSFVLISMVSWSTWLFGL